MTIRQRITEIVLERHAFYMANMKRSSYESLQKDITDSLRVLDKLELDYSITTRMVAKIEAIHKKYDVWNIH